MTDVLFSVGFIVVFLICGYFCFRDDDWGNFM